MQIILWLILFVSSSYSAEKKTANKISTSTAKTDFVKVENKNQIPGPASRKRYFPKYEKDLDLRKMETQIRAINLILNKETDKNKKIEFFIARSQLQVSLARAIGFKRTTLAEMTEKEKYYLETANKTLRSLIQFISNKKKKLAEVYYLIGLIEYEYDRLEEVLKYFNFALDLDPNSSVAPGMSLVTGELYYERDKYKEAITAYQKLYSKMSANERAMADYKTAWSFVGLTDLENAKISLLRIVDNKNESVEKSFLDDSIKDLAYLFTQTTGENEAIQFGVDKFKANKDRSKFYYQCLVYYMQKDKKAAHDELFTTLLNIEKDPFEVAKILALKVSFERQEYPTPGAYQAVLNLSNHLAKFEPKSREKFFLQEGTGLEDNSETIIKNFVSAYTGKIKMPPGVDRPHALDWLKSLLRIHLTWFPKSEKLDVLYGVWVDSCDETKDIPCLEYLKSVLARSQNIKLVPVYQVCFVKLIAQVDQIYQKDSKKYEDKLVQLLEEFLQQYPQYEKKIQMNKKLSLIYLSRDSYKQARPFLEDIYLIEPTSENLYRLLYAEFKLGEAEKVVMHPDLKKYKDSKILELEREASLSLAEKSKKDGRYLDYERNLKNYLASQPAQEKASLVIKDYFRELLRQKEYSRIASEWTSLNVAEYKTSEIEDLRQEIFVEFILAGEFATLDTIKSDNMRADTKFRAFVFDFARRGVFSKDDFETIRKFKPEEEVYVLSLASLFMPSQVLEVTKFYNSFNEGEKQAIQNAKILLGDGKTQSETPANNQTNENKILIQFDHNLSPLFKEIDRIKFPHFRASADRYNQDIEWNVTRIKKVRNKITKEMERLPLAGDFELLQAAIGLEEKMVLGLKNAPLPGGMNAAQAAEYKKGLSDLAVDYENQVIEYRKLQAEVKRRIEDDINEKKKNELPSVDPVFFSKKIKTENADRLTAIFKKNGPLAALVHWDALFASNQIEIKDYYFGKVWIVLRYNSNLRFRDYLLQELKSAKMDDIIESWRREAK